MTAAKLASLTARVDVLEATIAPPAEQLRGSHRATCRLVLELVSFHTGISQSLILGHNRTARIVRARHLAYLLAHEVTGMTFPQIAAAFDRDHTSIMHGAKQTLERIDVDHELYVLTDHLRSLFRVAFG